LEKRRTGKGEMKRNELIIMVILTCTVILQIPPRAWAQTIVTGGFSGTITDPTGATVPSAAVSLTSETTGDITSSVTGGNGEYVFSLLKPGEYRLIVTKDGFKTYSRRVSVLLGQNLTVNIGLDLGPATTTVEVNDLPPLLQTENANITTTLTREPFKTFRIPGTILPTLPKPLPAFP
jgi:hypothetical protein